VYNVPMAVEEPSVIAAATYAGRLVSRGDGGFHTTTTGQVMTAQIAIDDAAPGSKERILQAERELHRDLTSLLDPLTRRGGGYRGIDVSERISGGTVLMAILTNAAPRRRARACFSIPVAGLGRGTFDGATMARRVVRANQFADTDPLRAVTHNKGIMNGITSVALATGNDTRAIEAAAHAHAVRDGAYRALTEYRIDDERLVGSLELPLAMGTVGGAVGFHPVSSFALKVLFLSPDIEVSADRLSRITVSIGLAQNLAALLALVGEGIQKGHMRQHSRRLAWKAGARDEEIQELAQRVWSHGTFNIETAQELLHELRRER
jgi:hydroxymethylglutaryl-CoA reductase